MTLRDGAVSIDANVTRTEAQLEPSGIEERSQLAPPPGLKGHEDYGGLSVLPSGKLSLRSETEIDRAVLAADEQSSTRRP
jgi:hypothetical protein